MVSLPRQTVSKSLVICKILHFRKLNRNLVYFSLIEDLTLQLLITLNGISMTPPFLKKDSINSLPKKQIFCKILHFTTFYSFYMKKGSYSEEEQFFVVEKFLTFRGTITQFLRNFFP